MKPIYVNYAEYNLWANQRMASVFSDLPDERSTQPIVSSFPSVKLTCLHIWDAESIWLKRLQGISPIYFPSKDFTGDTGQALEGMLKTSKEFLDFVAGQEDDFFGKQLHFKTISFGEQSQFAFEMIHHCLNHSTYHRGQLTTMARQLGIGKLPSTDLIYFLREKGQ